MMRAASSMRGPGRPEKHSSRVNTWPAFAAASDEARPILTGVLARFEGDQLTLAAADNYRIAVKTIPILDAVPETSVVIPARALNELARVLADVDDVLDSPGDLEADLGLAVGLGHARDPGVEAGGGRGQEQAGDRARAAGSLDGLLTGAGGERAQERETRKVRLHGRGL